MKKRSRKSGIGNTSSNQRIPHELAAIVGVGPLTREQLVNRLFWYVQQNGLQEDATRIHVARDANLRSLFRREKTVPFVNLVARVA
jgi:chromatin remodeling complex protein RSC6